MTLYEDKISPPKRVVSINWRELYQYKDLFWVLAWRDFAVRYKQTALGTLWAIFRPLASMLIYTFVFSKGLRVETDSNIPYPVFVFAGQLFWLFFSETLSGAANSMVSNAAMVQKIYFPRIIIPSTPVLTALVDLGIAFLIYLAIMFYYGIAPSIIGIALLPLLLLITILTTLGAGMFLAALNVKYRDVRHAIPFITQMLFFVTPIVYPVTIFNSYPLAKGIMLWLNPMAGVITNARAGIIGNSPLDWYALVVAGIMSIVYFVFGLYYFKQTEKYFADII